MPMSLPSPEAPNEASEPVFQAPWEAKAFAIVNQLASDQKYSWAEWTEQFVGEISAAEAEPKDARTYYERWVDACEKLLIAKGILDSESIEQKIEELLSEKAHEHQHSHENQQS